MHRHPSNNLVLYTTTNIQADTLRICSKDWIPLLSYKLQLHNPVHVVVIHASQCPSALLTPNTWPCLQKWTQILNPAPCFVKWTSSNAVQLGESHSLIRIGFVNSDQEKTTVKQKQFYRIFNKKIEFSQKIKPHFMNCPKRVTSLGISRQNLCACTAPRNTPLTSVWCTVRLWPTAQPA